MAKKLDHKFWVKYFKVYDVLNLIIPYQELLDTIVQEADINTGDLVLDAGCGTGNLSVKVCEKGAKVTGIDYCIEALDRHRQKNPSADLLVHDLTKPLPFPDNYFNAVVCNNVLYTLDKGLRPAIVKEFYRVLKPDGRAVISNVHTGFKPFLVYTDAVHTKRHRDGLWDTIKVVSKMIIPTLKMLRYNKMITDSHKHGTYNFMTKDEQVELLRSNSFKNIKDNISVYSDQAILNSGKK